MPSIAGSMLRGLMTSISLTLVQCSRAARIEGPRTSGKGEGVSGRIAVGGVTKVDIHVE